MKLKEKAYAKINLFLDVLSVRSDGFHNIRSVMHSLDLSDTLEISIEENENTVITLSTDIDLPVDINNLAYRAAKVYLDGAGIAARIDIRISKRIPISAGLGGGSSDAAAVLRALNKAYGAYDREGLIKSALSIGSDVPYALFGGTAICEGRGEPVSHVTLNDELFFVVSKSDDSVSARDAYTDLDSKYMSDSGALLLDRDYSAAPQISFSSATGLIQAPIFNVFESVVGDKLAGVASIKEILYANGALASLMSGSGPAVFAIFDKKSKAENATAELRSLGYYAVTALSAPDFS